MNKLEEDCFNESISGNEKILKEYSKILRVLKFYYQGWSLFFIEDEYVYSVFNNSNTSIKLTPRLKIDITEDEEIRVTNNNIISFINSNSNTNTNTNTSSNTNNINRREFMSTLFSITTVITRGNICALCKNEIKELNHTQVHLPCSHKFHRDCLSNHMKITPYCPVCLVPIRLTSTNLHNYNPKLAEETIVQYITSNIQKIFPSNTEKDKNATDAIYSKIIFKENYVLALDTQRISNKKEFLYFWYSTPTENIVACAVDPKLKSVLLTPFMNKKNSWKHVLVNTKK
jgi:hypothetical protein